MQSTIVSILFYIIRLIPGFLAIGLVIFIHELGHFIASKIFHVDVDVLSYGFGPKLFSIKTINTEFRLSMIPFGGYCRMKGSMDLTRALSSDSDTITISEQGSYFATSPIIRFLIYFAGPLTNFLLAILLIAFAASIPVEHLSDPALLCSIGNYPTLFNSDLIQDGIEYGDIALSSEEYEFADFQDLVAFLEKNMGDEVPLKVLRNGNVVNTTLYPLKVNGSDTFAITNIVEPIIGRSDDKRFNVGDRIESVNGIEISNTYDFYSLITEEMTLSISDQDGFKRTVTVNGTSSLPFAWKSDLRRYRGSNEPFRYGARRASELFTTTLKALGALLSFHREAAKNVITSPMNAANTFTNISSIAIRTSFSSFVRTLMMLLAMVSISICVGNILPIPTFDGGQMLITLTELVKRKPLRPKSYLLLQLGGMIVGYLFVTSIYLLA